MGYYMTQGESYFIMKKENFDGALSALKNYFKNINDKAWIWGKKVLDASTIDDAMGECIRS